MTTTKQMDTITQVCDDLRYIQRFLDADGLTGKLTADEEAAITRCMGTVIAMAKRIQAARQLAAWVWTRD